MLGFEREIIKIGRKHHIRPFSLAWWVVGIGGTALFTFCLCGLWVWVLV